MTNREYIIDNKILFSDALKMHQKYAAEIFRENTRVTSSELVRVTPTFEQWLDFDYKFEPRFKAGDIFTWKDEASEHSVFVITSISEDAYDYAYLNTEVKYAITPNWITFPTIHSASFCHENDMIRIGTVDREFFNKMKVTEP